MIITFEKVYKRSLKNVNFEVQQGEFLHILSGSSIDKSTLFKLFIGNEKPHAGRIFVDLKNLAKFSKSKIQMYRRKIGLISSNLSLFPYRTVRENMDIVSNLVKCNDKMSALKILNSLGLRNKIDMYPHMLSSSEQQKLKAARALYSNPEFFLAEEPEGACNVEDSALIMKLICEMNMRGTSTVIITDRKKLTDAYPAKVIEIK